MTLLLIDPVVVAIPSHPSISIDSYLSTLHSWHGFFKHNQTAVLSFRCAEAILKANLLPDYKALQDLCASQNGSELSAKDIFGTVNRVLSNTPYLEDRLEGFSSIDVYEESVVIDPNLLERLSGEVERAFRSTIGSVAYVTAHTENEQSAPVHLLTHPIGASSHADVSAQVECSHGTSSIEAVLPLIVDPVASSQLATLDSWEAFSDFAQDSFRNLTFCPSLRERLYSEEFNSVIAESALRLLSILNEFKDCFDEDGRWTPRAREIFRDYFSGYNAYFSDESETNKSDHGKDLTFPISEDEKRFCPYHGKIRHRTYRLHFSWPIKKGEPLYIVYLGPKITKD